MLVHGRITPIEMTTAMSAMSAKSVVMISLLCAFLLLQPATLGAASTKKTPGGSNNAQLDAQAKQTRDFDPDKTKNIKPKLPFGKPFAFFAAVKPIPHREEMLRTLRELSQMQVIWTKSLDWSFDAASRPHCKNDAFLALKKGMNQRLFNQGAYLELIVKDDVSAANRASAYFGASLLPNITNALRVFSYLPYEADAQIRQNGFRFMLPFLRTYLPLRGKPAPDPPNANHKNRGHPRSREYRYVFDLLPLLDLLRAPAVNDRVAALEALTLVTKARVDRMALAAHEMKLYLIDALASKQGEIARAARALVKELDKEDPKREVPLDGDEAKAHFIAILRAHFPEIRLNKGLCDLYPGPKLDTLLASAKRFFAKKNNNFGKWEAKKTITPKIGVRWPYGLMIKTLPAELLKLGLAEGMLLRSINGTPMMKTGRAVYAFIEKRLEQGVTTFRLEWISAKGQTMGRTYRVHKDW